MFSLDIVSGGKVDQRQFEIERVAWIIQVGERGVPATGVCSRIPQALLLRGWGALLTCKGAGVAQGVGVFWIVGHGDWRWLTGGKTSAVIMPCLAGQMPARVRG